MAARQLGGGVTRERLLRWVAALLPRRLVYFAAIRLVNESLCDPEFGGLGDLTAVDALRRWNGHGPH